MFMYVFHFILFSIHLWFVFFIIIIIILLKYEIYELKCIRGLVKRQRERERDWMNAHEWNDIP